MAHKTITISVEAYNALKNAKETHDSFTDIILKTFRKSGKSDLRDYIEAMGPDEELADCVEKARKEMRRARLRKVDN